MSAKIIEHNLLVILDEVRPQVDVGKTFPIDIQGFDEQIEQIREYIEDAGECEIAYEVLVAMIEQFPFKLSGKAAIRLLEVGLLLQFKTDRPEDSQFDTR